MQKVSTTNKTTAQGRKEGPTSFVLVGMAGVNFLAFRDILGLPKNNTVICGTSQEYFAQNTLDPKAPLILVYRDCLSYMVEQMMEKVSPVLALEAWLQAAEPLIGLLRARRSQALVFEYDDAISNPKPVRHKITQASDHSLGANAPEISLETPDPDPVLLYLAQDVARHSSKTRRAQVELEVSLSLQRKPASAEQPTAELVFSILQSGVSAPDPALEDRQHLLEEDLEHKRLKISVLNKQLGMAVEKFEKLKREHEERTAKLKARVSEQTATLAVLANERRAESGQAKELEDLRNARQHWLYHELEEAFVAAESLRSDRDSSQIRERELEQQVEERDARQRELEQQVEERDARQRELEQQVEERDGEINALRTSTSWRITEPLRHVRRTLSRGKADD